MSQFEKPDLGMEPRPATTVSYSFFQRSLTNQNCQHYIFRDTGAKKLQFTDCDFSYCFFERAYFHNCTFVNCKFVGARFVDCNFRGATFEGCSFEYATFRQTQIAHKQILVNLPAWPNVRRELVRSLRKNAEGSGDAEAVKVFVREELTAAREHLKKAREGKESYYAQKYKGLANRISVRWQSLWVWLDWHVWGHGEYPWRIVRTIALTFGGAVVWQVTTDPATSMTMPLIDLSHAIAGHLKGIIYSYLGLKVVSMSDGMAAFLGLARYISLGLFISVLYKTMSRR